MDQPIADRAAKAYMSTVDITTAFMWSLKLREDDLPTTQEAVLHELRAQGRMNLTQLAHQVSVAKQTMTDISTKLIKLGYVRRVYDESNRRQILLELTPEGLAYENEFEHVRFLHVRDHVFSSLSEEELLQLHDACQTLNRLQLKTVIGEKYGSRSCTD